MRAVPGRLPVNGREWAWELKWGGIRALAAVGANGFELIGHDGELITQRYPEPGELADMVAHRRMVLDGEIVSVNDTGGVEHGLLRSRERVSRPRAALLRRAPVSYHAFDLLRLDGHDLTGESYLTRRKLLASLGLSQSSAVRVPPHYREWHGPRLLDVAREHGVEGVVAKHLSSHYHPGRQSDHWIELSLLRGCEAVIGGWLPETTDGAGTVRSVLLGVYDEAGRLTYIGNVGSGFSDTSRRALSKLLREISDNSCPFATRVPDSHARQARWVRPVFVCDVNYRAISASGRLHRPSWRGLRADIDPRDRSRLGSLRLNLHDSWRR